MNKRYESLREKYTISPSSLAELESEGLLGNTDGPAPGKDFTEQEIRDLSRILTLKNAGIEPETIKEYILMENHGKSSVSERLQILTAQRKKHYHQLHLNQKKIDRLDYLIHELKNRSIS